MRTPLAIALLALVLVAGCTTYPLRVEVLDAETLQPRKDVVVYPHWYYFYSSRGSASEPTDERGRTEVRLRRYTDGRPTSLSAKQILSEDSAEDQRGVYRDRDRRLVVRTRVTNDALLNDSEILDRFQPFLPRVAAGEFVDQESPPKLTLFLDDDGNSDVPHESIMRLLEHRTSPPRSSE
ncbi:MAG: hypothetical protein AAGD00_00360 [Planctomycetota bacterium]